MVSGREERTVSKRCAWLVHEEQTWAKCVITALQKKSNWSLLRFNCQGPPWSSSSGKSPMVTQTVGRDGIWPAVMHSGSIRDREVPPSPGSLSPADEGLHEWHWTSLAWWLTEPVGTVLISSFGFLLRLLSRANSLALLVCWDADCLPWPSPAVYHAVIQHSVWVGPLSTACSGLIIITLPCCRTAEKTALHWGTGLLVHGNVLGRHCSPTRETGHDLHKCILDSHGEELPS